MHWGNKDYSFKKKKKKNSTVVPLGSQSRDGEYLLTRLCINEAAEENGIHKAKVSP